MVLSAEHVHLDSGTGCVHTAPGTGPEDFIVGKKNGMDVFCPIGFTGAFRDEAGKYGGLIAKKDADPQVIEDLRGAGLLLHQAKVTHEYPICWRCKTPLIFLATSQWFFSTESMREKMREANKGVKWVPDWAGSAWFDSWLANLQDWCISRQRYWGVPLPIWTCDSCGEIEVVGAQKELPEKPHDLHMPWIDKIKWQCKKCGTGTMKRVPDIFDVWGDSGSAAWASQKFPSENHGVLDETYPADFIIEGKDQIRGWFNSLMALGILATGRPAFKQVYMHGFVNDELGRKFSKSLGNFVSPEEVMPKYGAEGLRFFFLAAAAPGEDMFYSDRHVREAFNNLRILYNNYAFAGSYMKLGGFSPARGRPASLALEDRWLLSRLNSLITDVTAAMDSYDLSRISDTLKGFFVNDLSRTYIKLVRDRMWVGVRGEDSDAAYWTLHEALSKLLVLCAPVTPMLAEYIHQNFTRELDAAAPKSVHFLPWPEADGTAIDKDLERAFFTAQAVIEGSMAARNSAGVKLRHPVREILVVTSDEAVRKAVGDEAPVILKMANAKGVSAVLAPPAPEGYAKGVVGEGSATELVVYVSTARDDALMGEAAFREITRKIQQMRKENGFNVSQKIDLELALDERLEGLLGAHFTALKDKVGAASLSVARLNTGEKVFSDGMDLKDLDLGTVEIGFSKAE